MESDMKKLSSKVIDNFMPDHYCLIIFASTGKEKYNKQYVFGHEFLSKYVFFK